MKPGRCRLVGLIVTNLTRPAERVVKFYNGRGTAEQGSLTTLREKLVKIGARIVRHGRYVVFQLAEVYRGRCSPESGAASAGCGGHRC